MNLLYQIIEAFWNIVTESAIWLLIGFTIGGIIKKYIPKNFIRTHLAKNDFLSIVKASCIGIPIPLCSCSIIPVSKSIYSNGASKGATAAFMISTPEIGIDSFLLTNGLLGTPIAILRTICAFLTALISGSIVNRVSKDSKEPTEAPHSASCCVNNKLTIVQTEEGILPTHSFLYYSFRELPEKLSTPLLIGFFVSAMISVLLPADIIPQYVSDPFAQIILVLLLSIPLYICASSSTPIAATLLLKGLSPGAALVFLLAGPATNTSTILAAKQMFGKRGAYAYLLSIFLVTLTIGILANLFLKDILIVSSHLHDHTHNTSHALHTLMGIILLALLITPKFKKIM